LSRKFSDEDLRELAGQGLGGADIARRLGVTKGAVSQRLKKLNMAITKDVSLRSAPSIVNKEINALEQLQKINDYANELLDLLMRWNRGDEAALQILERQVRKVRVKGSEEEITEYQIRDPRELALKSMQEIRGQLKLQLEIFQTLYDMNTVAEFQAEVLEAIEDAAPEIREKIVNNLQKRRAICSTLGFPGTTVRSS
jgi:predicted transcriptional regulator